MTGAMYGRSIAFSACIPTSGVISANPDACMILESAPPAIMPTSPHGPHCTLRATRPCSRRPTARLSRHEFAAE
eukprot:7391433-Prymnesium_polylepis.1